MSLHREMIFVLNIEHTFWKHLTSGILMTQVRWKHGIHLCQIKSNQIKSNQIIKLNQFKSIQIKSDIKHYLNFNKS